PRALKSFEVMSLGSQAVRRAGSAVLDLCYVACGRLDGYWEHMVEPWDIAAGALMVLEAGGTVTATDGSAFRVDDGQVLASNGLRISWARYPRTSWLAAACLAAVASLGMRAVGADVAPLLSLLAVVALGIGGAFASPVLEAEPWLA